MLIHGHHIMAVAASKTKGNTDFTLAFGLICHFCFPCVQKCPQLYTEHCKWPDILHLFLVEYAYIRIQCIWFTTSFPVCEPFTYGLNCMKTCKNCRYGKACNSITGVCSAGCKPGWSGENCDKGLYEYNSSSNRTVVERIIPIVECPRSVLLYRNSTPRITVYIALLLPRTIYYIVNYPWGKNCSIVEFPHQDGEK